MHDKCTLLLSRTAVDEVFFVVVSSWGGGGGGEVS